MNMRNDSAISFIYKQRHACDRRFFATEAGSGVR
ncbi:hypothetical protein SAMN05216186_13725 [Pseudomonas indica]|uniref:Uncharacterized protein n=1 Tax=Pseudomonas indica TaxID=137658 RepID=A0A1G9PCM5_9PSED|nr:hypothetical protein SAMN05216186_13725 [Pseudomonas indica]